jgi:thymidylate synthase (FAD)
MPSIGSETRTLRNDGGGMSFKVTLQNDISNSEELIEKAARVCYASEPKGDRGKFLQRLIQAGHESVLEHASATFLVEGISRACSHQLVRHRIASYSQRSQRYVNEEGFDYVVPDSFGEERSYARCRFEFVMDKIQACYQDLIKHGVPKEDARFVLPNACETQIMVTMNFRALRNFFKVRLDPKAQWEIRQLAQEMIDICVQHAPNVFRDIWEDNGR